jgi:hypothetical protein
MRRRRKSKKLIAEVADRFVEKLTTLYPGVDTEIIIPGMDGSDVWIRVLYPEALAHLDEAIQYKAADLYFDFYDDYGVTVVASVVPNVHGRLALA